MAENKPVDTRWWEKDEESPSARDSLWAASSAVQRDSSKRLQADQLHMRMYGSLPPDIDMLTDLGVMSTPRPQFDNTGRLVLNICKNMSQTVTARIGKAKPRPLFLPTDTSFRLTQQCKKLVQFNDGTFDALKVYPKLRRMFHDSTIFTNGVLKVFCEPPYIRVERVLASQLFVVEEDAANGDPSQMYQVDNVDADKLIAAFATKRTEDGEDEVDELMAQEIRESERPRFEVDDVVQGSSQLANKRKVVESWKLPSAPGAEDGRHMIVTSRCILKDEPWEPDWFPFVMYSWDTRVTGYWGQSLIESLKGIQLAINYLLQRGERIMQLISVPRVYMQGALLPKSKITNEIGSIVRYSGPTPPIFQTPPALPPEYFAILNFYIQQAYEVCGISQLSARSQLPAGVESKVAMQFYHDVESERFNVKGQEFEEAAMQVSRMLIYWARWMYRTDKAHDVEVGYKAPGAKWVRKIKWSEIDLDDDRYVIQMFPTSQIPATPTGKLDYIEKMLSLGAIDNVQALQLLDMPSDVDLASNLAVSSRTYVEKCISDILDAGEKGKPVDPLMNLNYAASRGLAAYNNAMVDEVPDERVSELRAWLKRVDDEIEKAKGADVAPETMESMPEDMAMPEGDMMAEGMNPQMIPAGAPMPEAMPQAQAAM